MANVPLFSVTNQYTSSISCTFKLQVLFRIKHTCTASTLLFYMFILTLHVHSDLVALFSVW